MKTILIVDDDPIISGQIKQVLSDHYITLLVSSTTKMFLMLEQIQPDLILLDLVMPEISGMEAMTILRASDRYHDIPVMVLTGTHDPVTEVHCLELGAVDFMPKPFAPQVLLNRVKLHINVSDLVRERTEKYRNLQSAIINILASLVEGRDKITGGHLDRTANYIQILIQAMKSRRVYEKELDKLDVNLLVFSAKLHDVGKIVVPDAILNKPGPLTKEEFEIIKTHAAEGERIITQMVEQAGKVEFLTYARLFSGYHHEWWDGTGYPHKMKGLDIPLLGRIMAVVDVYDALISERPYKKGFTSEKATSIIIEEANSHFDEKIVKVFTEVQKEFQQVNRRLQVANSRF